MGERWEYFDWKRDAELAATRALPAAPAAQEERPPDILHPPPVLAGGYQPSPGESPERTDLRPGQGTGTWTPEEWSEFRAQEAMQPWENWDAAFGPQPLPGSAAEEQSFQGMYAYMRGGIDHLPFKFASQLSHEAAEDANDGTQATSSWGSQLYQEAAEEANGGTQATSSGGDPLNQGAAAVISQVVEGAE